MSHTTLAEDSGSGSPIEVILNQKLEEVKRLRQARITPFNFIGVNWISDLLVHGAKTPLQQNDLYDLPVSNQANTLKNILGI